MSQFTKIKTLTPWRKLALATWKNADDPSVYGFYEFDGTRVLAFLKEYNKTAKTRVTLTHFFAKTLAITLARHPAINGIIKWGHIYKRDTVDIFLQVAVKPETPSHTAHLSGVKLEAVDQKSLEAIAAELAGLVKQIREQQDPQFQKTFSLANVMPVWLLKPLIRIHEFLVYNLGVNLPALGIRRDPFGSAMLTSVGSLGTPPGWAPLVPHSRVPLIICLGEVTKKPWVVNGQVLPRPIIPFTITFDHRFMDGVEGAAMLATFMEIVSNPERFHT